MLKVPGTPTPKLSLKEEKKRSRPYRYITTSLFELLDVYPTFNLHKTHNYAILVQKGRFNRSTGLPW